jgi:hypothetical protein
MDHLHLVYEDDLLKLFWDTRSRYHIAEWRGAMDSQKLKTAAYACVNSSRTRQSPRWMADVSQAILGESTDQAWLVEEFYPRLARNGVRYVAFVVADATLAQIPVKRMNAAYGDKGSIEFAYHSSRTAAATWLAGQTG